MTACLGRVSNRGMCKFLTTVIAVGLSGSIFTAPPATETTLRLKVKSVRDGDTLTEINKANKQVKVRLDAMELPQPYGQSSRNALAEKKAAFRELHDA